jgi:hypothetical protein
LPQRLGSRHPLGAVQRRQPRRRLLLLPAALALGACGLSLQGTEELLPDASTSDAATIDVTVGESGGRPEGGDAAPDHPADGPPDAGSDDAPPESSPGHDASADAPGDGPSDASSDAAVEACSTAIENCTNGIDDNCNGLVDCADLQCATQGFACQPSLPPTWSFVSYDEIARPPCPAGWGSSAPLVEGPNGGTGCSCSCGLPLSNPCVAGTATMSLGQSSCDCAGVQGVPLVSDGGCDPIGAPIGSPCGPWGHGQVTVIDAGQVGCAATEQLPPITYLAQGQVCAPLAAGAGCADAGECLPPVVPQRLCVAQVGLPACPFGFPEVHVVYAPSSVTDTRVCGACGCTSLATSCNAASVTLFDDPACTTDPVTITADRSCDGFTGDPSDAGWFVYGATPDTMACTGPSTTPFSEGGVEVTTPITICCP